MEISITENTKLSLELFVQEFSEICGFEDKEYYAREEELKNYYVYQDGFVYHFDKFTVIHKMCKKSFLNVRELMTYLFFDEFDSIIYYFVDHPKNEALLLIMKFGHKRC